MVKAVKRERIMDKARKLRALAEDTGATVAEAAAAAEKLQRLLIQHHIETHDLDATEASKVGIYQFDLGKGNTVNWRRDLIHTITINNGGRCVYWRNSNEVEIIAHESSWEVINYLYFYLRDVILDLARQHYLRDCEKYGVTGIGTGRFHAPTYFRSFCAGARNELHNLMKEQRQGAEQDAGANALVVVMDQEVEDKLNELYPNLTSSKRTSKIDYTTYAKGAKAARNINLGKPIKDATGSLRIPLES